MLSIGPRVMASAAVVESNKYRGYFNNGEMGTFLENVVKIVTKLQHHNNLNDTSFCDKNFSGCNYHYQHMQVNCHMHDFVI